ncbi:hypothetical protein LBK6_08915 [Leptospira borgpetersenii serovar Hardjo]|nr:hypothetical protein LBK6_08915 [Leptospira borgpetersenii serovar Hardjo]AWV70289.1 hypothetical protein B9T54_09700 [Leptospira borgpetersenii serovar Hardjo-bovis]TQE53438.1 hypothetical protein FFZ95_07470 [Leptospira borgpetersenii]AMX61706.1 hypothetical protein LBK9_08940 [Leptospira borgpetersenii serovar Hardjo]AMX64950.1 hypothetical protein LBK30_08980 [Leptospira borgpetersenii serovar Hardjo]
MKLYLLIRIFCSFRLQWKKVNKIYPISVNLNIIFFGYNGAICIFIEVDLRIKEFSGFTNLINIKFFWCVWSLGEKGV